MYIRVPGFQSPDLGKVVIAPLDRREEAASVHGAALVIDCIGEGSLAGYRTETCRPSVGTHGWTVEDLDRIVALALPILQAGGNVVVHCESGWSQSVAAAAALLVAAGSHGPTAAYAAAGGPSRPFRPSVRLPLKWREAREGYDAWCAVRV